MQLVAVYGSLMRNFGNNSLLIDSELIGEETIKLPFKMLDLGHFPGLIEINKLHNITLEIYKVNDNTFISLDRLEGYPNFYNRKLITTAQGDAWIYYLNTPREYYNEQIVESGNWRAYHEREEIFPKI